MQCCRVNEVRQRKHPTSTTAGTDLARKVGKFLLTKLRKAGTRMLARSLAKGTRRSESRHGSRPCQILAFARVDRVTWPSGKLVRHQARQRREPRRPEQNAVEVDDVLHRRGPPFKPSHWPDDDDFRCRCTYRSQENSAKQISKTRRSKRGGETDTPSLQTA